LFILAAVAVGFLAGRILSPLSEGRRDQSGSQSSLPCGRRADGRS
jgi:hypothetical protein